MSTSYSSEQNTHARLSHLIIFVLVMAAGTLFFAVHMLNGWLFNAVALTDHISLLYLPAFLRLMNVLVLGLLWGTVGTAVGGALLFIWMQDSLLMSVLNTTVSAGGAALAVWLMRIQQGRPLLLSRLSDLLKLSLLLLFCLKHLTFLSILVEDDRPCKMQSILGEVMLSLGFGHSSIKNVVGGRLAAPHPTKALLESIQHDIQKKSG
jgi:hypothetical protein